MAPLTRLRDIQLSFLHINPLSDVSILDALMSFASVRRYASFPLASHFAVSSEAVGVRYTVLGSPSKNLTYILLSYVRAHSESRITQITQIFGLNYRWHFKDSHKFTQYQSKRENTKTGQTSITTQYGIMSLTPEKVPAAALLELRREH